jgi:hypothetical protein
MNTPLPILRKRADDALQSFTAHSGHEPEEVWQQFSTLRLAEINTLKNLRQN